MPTNKNLHILLLEDRPADAELILREIRKEGIEFTSVRVETEEAFREQLQNGPPGLILADYNLPSYDGLSALAVAKSQCPETPFILVSGSLGEEKAIESLLCGATDYVLKQRLARLGTAVRRAFLEAEKKKELRQNQLLLSEAQRLGHVGSWFWNMTDPITWSEEMYRIHGVSRATFSPTPEAFVLLIHPNDRQAMQSWIAACAAGEAPGELEYRINLPDGTARTLLGRGNVVLDATNRPIHMAGTAQDITEWKRSQESSALLATAVEQAAECILITNTAGIIQYVNPAFERISGYARAEVIGRTPSILKSGEHDAEFYRQMWEVLTGGDVWNGHMINKKKDGTFYEEEATISPVHDKTGANTHYVAVKRDITREVQLENQFRQSQKMEAVGQLAGGIAHDFNNILAVILMQAELAGRVRELPEKAREGLHQIRDAAKRAATLTRQLLLFSRKEVMRRREMDLNTAVTGITNMLLRIVGEDIPLQLNIHSRPLITFADPGMLDQVLMNLVVNARDAMPDGGRIVIETSERNFTTEEASLIPDAKPGRYVSFSVTDSGSGITLGDLSRIFEPFFTTKEPGKGTGLGLSTVFGIVKLHGGSIVVDSKVGSGTTFRVFLPATQAGKIAPIHANEDVEPRGGSETILLVEDEPDVQKLTRMVLEEAGYHVLEAPHGVEALRVSEQYPETIHLLLTDLVLPEGVDGRTLAARLLERRPKLRVVFVSGYSSDLAGRELVLSQRQVFIQKPYAGDQILEAVRQCLDE